MSQVSSGGTPDAWRAQGKWFAHGVHRIFYRDDGGGAPLLCLHGFPTSSWDWHLIWGELTAKFRAIAPDFLGFGFSSKPARFDYSIAAQADAVTALLVSLQLPRVELLVHDYGTIVAQELLDRQRRGVGPIEVVSVCCLNGSIFPDLTRPRRIQRVLASPAGGLLSRLLSQRSISRSLRSVFGTKCPPSEELLSSLWSIIGEERGQQRMHQLLSYLAEREKNAERWNAAWTQAGVPRRLVSGAEDPVSGMHVVRAYRERVPGADVVVLDGVGHYAALEDPRGTLDAIESFHHRQVTSRAAVS